MSKKPRNAAKTKRIPKSVQLLKSVAKRFLNRDQEFAIQTTAGVIRDAVKGKGGFNSKKVPFARKEDGSRNKKTPYKWGTLGLSEVATAIRVDRGTISISSRSKRRKIAKFEGKPFVAYTVGKAIKGQSPAVLKQLAKSDAYKDKLQSRSWRKAVGR